MKFPASLRSLALAALAASLLPAPGRADAPAPTALVGPQPDGVSYVVPTDQVLTPAGTQVAVAGRPVTVAVHPDGQTASFTNDSGISLIVVDLASGTVKQRYAPPLTNPAPNVSITGHVYSADGTRLYTADVNGFVTVSAVAADGTLSPAGRISLRLPTYAPIVGGLALSADGRTLYAVLNDDNTLAVVDLSTQTLTARVPVGNAPFGVLVRGGFAYVTNQGGRRAVAGDVVSPTDFAYQNGNVPIPAADIVIDPVTTLPASGTVSVVDLSTNQVVKSLDVGLQPTALASFAGRYLLVTNTVGESVSVIDGETQTVVRTFPVQPFAGAPFGSIPNAVAALDDANFVVSLGGNNAVAQYAWRGPDRAPFFKGLIPVGWFPGALAVAPASRQLLVANVKGFGSLGGGRRTASFLGEVSLVPFQTNAQLRRGLARVKANNGWSAALLDQVRLPGDPAAPTAPQAVPAKIGDPSPIQHVIYVIKENRTYDQVFGDDPRGNADPQYLNFGAQITPNHHALATQFPLLDNFYDCALNSADGHQWCVQSIALDYSERPDAAAVRTYPSNGGDALERSPGGGYLWRAALRAGKTVRGYGEYVRFYTDVPGQPASGTWADWYRDSQILEGKLTGELHLPLGSHRGVSDVPDWDPYINRDCPNFNGGIPDQYRADIFLRDFAGYVADGTLPNLILLKLSADHTGGSGNGPQAEVADNDLALGRVVDAVSHSPYWASTAIFVVEDDTQAGQDHVDGHRGPALVVSPYARHGGFVDHAYYSNPNMVRTIEQILGLTPLNQRDLSAQPMRAVFTDQADLTPYDVRPNLIPLDKPATAATGALPEAWRRANQEMFARHPDADSQDLNLLNRWIWYSCSDFRRPYPGDARVLWPHEVTPSKQVAGAARVD